MTCILAGRVVACEGSCLLMCLRDMRSLEKKWFLTQLSLLVRKEVLAWKAFGHLAPFVAQLVVQLVQSRLVLRSPLSTLRVSCFHGLNWPSLAVKLGRRNSGQDWLGQRKGEFLNGRLRKEEVRAFGWKLAGLEKKVWIVFAGHCCVMNVPWRVSN